MQIDVLIIGQGLAGSLLAWEMLRQQLRVMVVDPDTENASKVAAGLVNPVTGQRLVKSADIDYLLPAARICYQQLAEQFKQEFFIPMPMLRILKNSREQKFANQRLQQFEYRDFLAEGFLPDFLNNSSATLLQQQTGFLQTRSLLTNLRTFFIDSASYRQTRLAYQEISLQPNLQWRDIEPQHIVFCEGHQAENNPWFGSLPFQLAKGEILSCETSAQCPDHILNFGHWLIPHLPCRFRLGATFEPGNTDMAPTEQAKNSLLHSLRSFVPTLEHLEITAHEVGIRPTTRDKQPFIGTHPNFNRLHIFNGFGAKGSLSIPWYAHQFTASLKQSAMLPLNANIQRYYASHFSD